MSECQIPRKFHLANWATDRRRFRLIVLENILFNNFLIFFFNFSLNKLVKHRIFFQIADSIALLEQAICHNGKWCKHDVVKYDEYRMIQTLNESKSSNVRTLSLFVLSILKAYLNRKRVRKCIVDLTSYKRHILD